MIEIKNVKKDLHSNDFLVDKNGLFWGIGKIEDKKVIIYNRSYGYCTEKSSEIKKNYKILEKDYKITQ